MPPEPRESALDARSSSHEVDERAGSAPPGAPATAGGATNDATLGDRDREVAEREGRAPAGAGATAPATAGGATDDATLGDRDREVTEREGRAPAGAGATATAGGDIDDDDHDHDHDREDGERIVTAPRVSFEEIEIHTSDGAVLRAIVDDPPSPVSGGAPFRATVVLGHAMFARKSVFGRRERPGLARALALAGYRTVAFDFRSHGDSTAPRADWGYDDLVRFDLPAVVDCVRARGEDQPVLVAGHSLGGHVALAAQATRRIEVDAIVALATNVWLRVCETSPVRWAAKRAVTEGLLAIGRRAGGIPARRLRWGTDDVPEAYLRDLFAGVTEGYWGSRDRTEDYLAALREVTIPVASVLGERDLLMCHPRAGEAFVRRCSGRVAFFHAPTGHMDMVTRPRGWPAVLEAVRWAEAAARTRTDAEKR